MEELKPVRCGCGGEVRIDDCDMYDSFSMIYVIRCKKCGIETDVYNSESEAVKAWNRAMSGKPEERTAEVMGEDGDYWHVCTDCDRSVEEFWKYCPICGARLEWE